MDLAKKNTLELLGDGDIFALFGYIGTPTLLSALPEVEKARKNGSSIFLFSNRTGAEQQRTAPYNQFVYNIRPSYAEETEALVARLLAQGAKKIGLFIQDDSYGQSGKTGVEIALKKREKSITGEVKYKRGTLVSESMKSQAQELLSKNVDAVISIASYEAAAAFTRDIRNEHFTGPIANISFVGSSDMLLLLQREGEKAHKDYTGALINSQVVPPSTATEIPFVADYVNTTKTNPVQIPESISNHNEIRPISFTGLEGYLNAKIFVEILKKIKGPITRASFIKTANEHFTLDLGLGEPIKFSKDSHQALHQIYLTEVVDGKFVLIKK